MLDPVTVLSIAYGLGNKGNQQEIFTPIGDLYRMTDSALLQPDIAGKSLEVSVVRHIPEAVWRLRLKVDVSTGQILQTVSVAPSHSCFHKADNKYVR